MLASCQKQEITIPESETVNMVITASQSNDTKTILGNDGKVKWNATGEKIKVCQVYDNEGTPKNTWAESSEASTTDEGQTMNFNVSFDRVTANSFDYLAIYPFTSVVTNSNTNPAELKIIINAIQTPTSTSYDGTEDILVAQAKTGLSEQPSKLSFAFKRMSSVGKMTITNLSSNENVKKIRIQSTGKTLTGRSKLNLNDASVVEYGYSGQGIDYVELDYSKETITANGMTAYFCVWPFSKAENEEISVTVTTDSKVFTKVINSPKALTFTEGKITSFTVDFNGIVGADNVKSYPFLQEFNNSKGDFVIEDITIPAELSYVWSTNPSYIKASAYYNKTKYEAESQLVSPVIDMSGAINPVLKFFNVAQYGTDNSSQLTLWVREKDGAWKQKEFNNYGDGSSWTMVSNTIDVSEYKGKTLQFAFKYTSSTASAPTWEIQKVYVDEVPTLSSIAWSGYTTTYSIGETFKKDGKVLATYSDGDVIDVTSEAEFSDLDTSTAGTKTITVTYMGKTTTGEISVTAGSVKTVTLQYKDGTTTNMTGNNDAAKVGLNETDWSVVGSKGDGSNFPGLNKSNYIAIYYNATKSSSFTVSSLTGATISSIKITYTGASYSKGKVLVGGQEASGSDGVYSINSNSFVITNGNTSNTQVRISSIVITYE